MNASAYKSRGFKSRSQSVDSTHNDVEGKSTLQFVDNRLQATAQRKQQRNCNNSPRSTHLSAIQEMLNSSIKNRPAAQSQIVADNHLAQQTWSTQKNDTNTDIPGNLKSRVEALSGLSMDDVKVHRNSSKPLQLQALAYAQGTDIYLGPGQEKQLPHEAWHVVQQKQGRVKPTVQINGSLGVNDDVRLEAEADAMGARAESSVKLAASVIPPIQKKCSGDFNHRPSVPSRNNFENQPKKVISMHRNGGTVQFQKGLTAKDKVFVLTSLGVMPAVVLATLDNGDSYRVELTTHNNQVYEVSHFIVDTDEKRLPSDSSFAKEISHDAEHEESIKTKIISELNKLITAKEKKMTVINRLSELADNAEISEADQEALNVHEGEASKHLTAMMLEVEARKKTDFEPFIVDDESFPVFIDDLQKAVSGEVKEISKPKKLHMIFLGDGHYTPVIVQIGTDEHLQIFSVDASGTPKNFGKFQSFADANFNGLEKDIHFYSDGDVQMDGFHCESFSIDDLNQMASMSTKELLQAIPKMHLPDIPEDKTLQPTYYQDIHTIDPRFMLNAQSNTQIALYKKGRDANDPGLKTMDAHIERHSVLHKSGAKKNRSIDFSRLQKLHDVRRLIQGLSLQEVESILDKRIYSYRDVIRALN